MSAQHATDRDFQDLIASTDEPVLVDFYADWCGPCRAMSSVVDQLADELEGQAKVVKVNVDQAPDTALQYGIQSIPAFVVFRDGQPIARTMGVVNKESLANTVMASA